MSAKTVLVCVLFLIAGLGFYLTFTMKTPATPPGSGPQNGVLKSDSVGAPGGAVPIPQLAALSEEDAKANADGLVLTLESLAKPGVVDRRLARIPNLFVPEGTPASVFLPIGPIKATWTGELRADIKDDFIFDAEGRGKLKLMINDVEAFAVEGDSFEGKEGKPFKLKKGLNKLVVTYESPAKGDSIMRLNWRTVDYDANTGFARESLSPYRLKHDATDLPFRQTLRVKKGREHFATLRCEACHGGEHIGANLAKEAMPELTMDAPNLSEAGKRLNTPWIAKWLKNPRALRNESTMPQVLHGATAEKDAEDIAGFLSTLGAPDKSDEKPYDAKSAERGVLFTQLGCIGCHMLPTTQKAEPGRVPLAYVRDKWKPAALRAFLHKPDAHYAWIRMPDFRLTDKEIEMLSAFILNEPISAEGKGEQVSPLKGTPDVGHGKELVETLGCLNCHNAGTTVTNKAKAIPFKEVSGPKWAQGCLSEKEESLGNAPNFHLSAEQRGALLAFVATDRSSLTQEALPEFAERQIASMRCTVCHNRDGKQALWEPGSKDSPSNDLETEQAEYKEPDNIQAPDGESGGEGKVKQHIPSITWIGEKLKPEWAAKFVDGKMDYKPRVWLTARMPGFHSRASLIVKGLAIEHGYPTVNPPEFKPDPELAEMGERLASEKEGLKCADCHMLGGENIRTKKAFEWPSINFKYVKERIMEPFYYKWMHEPIRMEPGTGMPTFAKGGTNQKDEFYGGDGHKQFEALWHYLQRGRDIKPPKVDEQ